MTEVQKHAKQKQTKQENPFFNLIFNILLPVAILNQLAKYFGEHGPLISLLVALSLPLGYGFYEYLRTRTHNVISILGFINVLFTGGFALMKLEGQWFAIKEAFFPFFIGTAVLVSAFMGKPFLKTLFWNDNVFQTRKIEDLAASQNQQVGLSQLFSQATFLFALSFFISSALNFWLASKIFLPLDPSLTEIERSQMLNDQIAQMTWKGYVVIALPMMVFMIFILGFLLRQLKRLTGLPISELLLIDPKNESPS